MLAGIYSIMWDSDLIYSYEMRQPVGYIAVIIPKKFLSRLFPLLTRHPYMLVCDPVLRHSRLCKIWESFLRHVLLYPESVAIHPVSFKHHYID